MKAWGRLLVLGVAALLLAQILARRSDTVPVSGADAPALALRDLAGNEVDLSHLRGRVVVVNFWASWCVPCQLEIPAFAAFWRRNQHRCFELLGVAEESGSAAEIALAAARFGIPYPVLVDAGGAAAERYRVPGYPRTFVIDAAGKVRRVFDGVVREEELERVVTPLLPTSAGTCPRA